MNRYAGRHLDRGCDEAVRGQAVLARTKVEQENAVRIRRDAGLAAARRRRHDDRMGQQRAVHSGAAPRHWTAGDAQRPRQRAIPGSGTSRDDAHRSDERGHSTNHASWTQRTRSQITCGATITPAHQFGCRSYPSPGTGTYPRTRTCSSGPNLYRT